MSGLELTVVDKQDRVITISHMVKKRLDELVCERGLSESRERARRLILAGEVKVNGQMLTKAGTLVADDSNIEIEAALPFVSRGGIKLDHALRVFHVDVSGMVAADVGASTGGFTDCLLQRGALRVYALDVGRGQLAWKLRQDKRVIVQEHVNVRYLQSLAESIDIAVIDVSFISLKLILPAVASWLQPDSQVIALIKPQFEAGKALVGKGGVVRDPRVHYQVLSDVLSWASSTGWTVCGLTASPICGPAGNREFLVWLTRGMPTESGIVQNWIENASLCRKE